jgi:predicted RNase H-like HicB family nuclease
MIDDYVVSVKDKKFVGIGKFLFDTVNEEWNIPHLHFMINKTDNGNFEATNLEFGLVSSGESVAAAMQHLAGLLHFHITSVMTEGKGYKEFIEAVNSRAMDDYWRAYRVIDFSFGEKGKDLSHEIDKKITRAIQEMFDRQVKDIITQRAEKKADEIIKAYEEITIFKLSTVQYTEIEANVA